MHGRALGSKPEAITGIPPKVNTGQGGEEPLSLAIVCVYISGESGEFSHLVHSVIFCF